jgi:hypothetical protein
VLQKDEKVLLALQEVIRDLGPSSGSKILSPLLNLAPSIAL